VHDLRQLEEEQQQKEERARYKLRARVLGAIMIPTWFPEYDPAIHELDHKFSVSSGYQNHLPLEIISARHNLRLLTPEENRRKGKKCSIGIEELVDGYRFNPFVTRVAAMLRRMPLWKLKTASVRISRRLRDFREARQQDNEAMPPMGRGTDGRRDKENADNGTGSTAGEEPITDSGGHVGIPEEPGVIC
jgi:hypothetical protein